MPVKIISQADNFLLAGASGGFQLTVDCSKQLRWCNKGQKLNEGYSHLIKGFSEACSSDHLHKLIDEFNVHYWLHRRPVFKGEQFTPILAQYPNEIRALPPASVDSIDHIVEKFDKFEKEFSQALGRDSLPHVSLSKLLHCVHPVSFWILDNRVNVVLNFWGYGASYGEFGRLLKICFVTSNLKTLELFWNRRTLSRMVPLALFSDF